MRDQKILVERLIAVPPVISAQINQAIIALVIEYVAWKIKYGRSKNLFQKLISKEDEYPRLRGSLAELADELNVRLKDEYIVSPTRGIEIDTERLFLPPQYKGAKSTLSQIVVYMGFVSGNLGHAGYNPKNGTITVNLLTVDLVEALKQDSVSLVITAMKRSFSAVTHELRHFVQYTVLRDPRQMKMLPGYNDDQENGSLAYHASPVEFDPLIGSLVDYFISVAEALEGVPNRAKLLNLAARVFVAAIPSRPDLSIDAHPFFSNLKKHSPKRWREAVKKFIHLVAPSIQ